MICLIFLSLITYNNTMKVIVDKIAEKRKSLEYKIKDTKLTIEREIYTNNKYGIPATITIYRKREKVRIESKEQRGEVTAISNGKNSCITWPDDTVKLSSVFDGLQVWKPSIAVQMCRPDNPNSPCLIMPREPISVWYLNIPVHKSKIIGEEKIKGRKSWVVSIEDTTSIFGKLWIDKELFAVVKGETQGKHKITVLWHDFRETPDLGVIPHIMEEEFSLFPSGKCLEVFTVKNIEINLGLSDTLFELK